MAAPTADAVCASDGCAHPVATNGVCCSAHWKRLDLHERARLLAAAYPAAELAEPDSTCAVESCSIPDTAAENVVVGEGFLCRSHWKMVPKPMQGEVIATRGNERVVSSVLAAIDRAERALGGRFPPRPAV